MELMMTTVSELEGLDEVEAVVLRAGTSVAPSDMTLYIRIRLMLNWMRLYRHSPAYERQRLSVGQSSVSIQRPSGRHFS